MGYPVIPQGFEQRRSQEMHDWDLQFEESFQSTGSHKTSPRLRHISSRDWSYSSPSSGKHANMQASPTLPLVSPAALSFMAKTPYGNSLSFSISSNTHWATQRSPLLRDLQTRLWNSKITWLALYFMFNLLLTLSNKSVLTSFPFPYTLTALHALCSTLGGLLLRWHGLYIPKRLTGQEELVLATFSFLYGLNIAVSNVSLNLVTVPFHQVVRAITPIFTLCLSSLLLNSHFSSAKLVSLVPVIFGVIFATYGDYYFTPWGLVLTLSGTLLASLKTIFTSVLQSSPHGRHGPYSNGTPRISTPGSWTRKVSSTTCTTFSDISGVLRVLRRLVPPRLDIHPLDLLVRMSPLAFIQCMIYSHLSGELDQLRTIGVSLSPAIASQSLSHPSSYSCLRTIDTEVIGGITFSQLLVLLMNGLIAFALNVVSFSANGKVGPLSMTVAANVKQVLTILFAVSMFNLTMTPMNALGISITIGGGAWYGWVEYATKTRLRKKEDENLTTG
ncbi:triose-phosphate transporter family-domain-containing protein [Irpex rosettiformis]|uniref:Triose-phosphate transporter family-domain-containing protein n=1 Tax=Irpex rosettiformis TaxID=378272 RepID=A0ACB8U1Z4_9APHY|nr:triose-phosphate transporter family-domain-containing protein [Irpex rosettiformis]